MRGDMAEDRADAAVDPTKNSNPKEINTNVTKKGESDEGRFCSSE